MKKYILYAEDDHDDFDLMKKALTEVNPEIELMHVTSGYEVIKFLQEHDQNNYPCLILMDVKMPLMDGMETFNLLKIDDRYNQIPVILFSTSTSPREEKTIHQAGTDLIKKPAFYEEWLIIAKDLAKYCSAIILFSIIS